MKLMIVINNAGYVLKTDLDIYIFYFTFSSILLILREVHTIYFKHIRPP